MYSQLLCNNKIYNKNKINLCGRLRHRDLYMYNDDIKKNGNLRQQQ